MGTYRFILALLVVVSHTNEYHKVFQVDIGTVAVTSFFFISGFLIPLAFDTHYSAGSSISAIGRFFYHRFLKIYPLYFASLAIVVAFTYLNFLIRGRELPNGYGSLTSFVQNFLLIGINQSELYGSYHRFNNPAWSLDVELQFYLLVPFIYKAFKTHPSSSKLVLLLASFVSCYLMFYPAGLVDIDRSLLAYSFYFVAGWFFFLSGRSQEFFLNLSYSLGISFSLLTIAFFIESIIIKTSLMSLSLMSLSCYFLVHQRRLSFSLLDKRLGELSYPIYILHFVLSPVVLLVLSLLRVSELSIPEIQLMISSFVYIFVAVLGGGVALRLLQDPLNKLRMK